jgi:abhydrolase domain-containing protein 13
VIDVAADSNYGSKVMCAVVENTFTSIPNMARHLISYVKFIPLICHKNRVSSAISAALHLQNHLNHFFLKFTSIEKVQKISAPILFVSGLNDSLVPSSMMSALHNQCKSSRKQLFQLATGGHMDTWNHSG